MPDRPSIKSHHVDLGLPIREFMYTIDQISFLLDIKERDLHRSYLFYQGRSVGVCPPDFLLAVNIAPAGESPEWRVAERHLKKWMRAKGWRVHDRSTIR